MKRLLALLAGVYVWRRSSRAVADRRRAVDERLTLYGISSDSEPDEEMTMMLNRALESPGGVVSFTRDEDGVLHEDTP